MFCSTGQTKSQLSSEEYIKKLNFMFETVADILHMGKGSQPMIPLTRRLHKISK